MSSEPVPQPVPEPSSFTEAVLGPQFFQAAWLRRVMALPISYRVAGLTALIALTVFVPYLGAVGLWDPWETHYGEVARMMIQRRDYVYPWWESSWFLSKPPLTMWMDVIGMQLVGTNRTPSELALYTEWGMRLPFALLSTLALSLFSMAICRVTNARTALATAFSLITMPMYWLITRQAVTDIPFVAPMVCAMSCAIIGQLDPSTRHRTGWWYGFYVFAGFATLGKGIMGFAVPAVMLIAYAAVCVIRWDGDNLAAHGRWLISGDERARVRRGEAPMPQLWAQLYTMKLGTGVLVWLAVCGAWYFKMFRFEGLDDENMVFWYRFIFHDHFNRLVSGVHTTTPGGDFTYFIQQGGYGMFPWIALVPGAIAAVSRVKLRGDRRDQLAVIAVIWITLTFSLVGFSATKFHHYIFPTLPGVALLIGLYIDRLWEEGVAANAVPLLLGLVLFALIGKDLAATPKDFTDLFVYNYDRPYPVELTERTISLFGQRPLWLGDLACVLLLGFGAYLAVDEFRAKDRQVFGCALAVAMASVGLGLLVSLSMGKRGQSGLEPTLAVGLGIALTAIYVGYESTRATGSRRNQLYAGAGVLAAVALGVAGVSLQQRGGDRLLPVLVQTMNLKGMLGGGFTLAAIVFGIAAIRRSKVMLFSSFGAVALAFALWFNWSHWVDLSHHWTQRDQFWRYWRQRQPDEPIAAFLMNWRGETFYSKNTVKQIPLQNANAILARYAALPGRKWALVEHGRLGVLRSAVGGANVTLIDRDLNNKFVLVTIE